MDIEQMLKELKDLSYTEQGYSGNTYERSVINAKYMDKVERVIRKYMSRNPYIEQVNMLSAKIYVYEQIIAKSNFAPFLDDIRQKPQEDILDKIKTEIEQGYCMEEGDYDKGRNMGLRIALQIIDEYKEGNWIVDSGSEDKHVGITKYDKLIK